MPADTFFDLKAQFLQSGTSPLIEDIRVDFLEINPGDYKAKYAHIRRGEFTSLLHFSRADLGIGILFEDCNFVEGVHLEAVVVKHFDDTIWPENTSILFKNCTFHGRVEIDGCSLRQALVFYGCRFTKELTVKKSHTSHEGIRLEKCTMEDHLRISECQSQGDIHLISSNLQRAVVIEYCSAENLMFSGSNIFAMGLELDYNVARMNIIFLDGLIRGEVHFTAVETTKGGLRLFGSQFEKGFFIDYSTRGAAFQKGICQYSIDSCKFFSGLFIKGTQSDKRRISPVRMIIIELTPNLSGNINFSDLDVGKVFMQGYNNSANISFTNVAVNELTICETTNQGGIIFSGLRASRLQWQDDQEPILTRSSAIVMSNTNLGKALFFQCNFSSFDLIDLHNVILTDISSSNVTWFSPLQLENRRIITNRLELKKAKKQRKHYEIEYARNNLYRALSSVREVYRQLKFASQKQGDVPLSLEFQRHEMHYYKQAVAVLRPRQWSEYLILWSSGSNNYGQSWLRALTGLLFFSALSYIPVGFYASSKLDYHHFATSWNDLPVNLKVLWDNIVMWVVLLNPTHRIKDLSDNIDDFPSVVYVFDLLSRIVVSYFIFQMVSAFRKFSK
ncbi:hypothetical protein DBR40_07440 [Pedobacter sp. KBW01]|uniref:pentapeptide repeat-containing protein n=1 Tax=Pedobacter sp. KBW01 TaxID=2153364 RepID=UPI000F5A1176|nr:pentapeptide repeat-containing protein [Pedobacter sp. KBW01]RQO77800.1 hypothetical protein DBR40_07440 [Pedobacter sp. KBW01]